MDIRKIIKEEVNNLEESTLKGWFLSALISMGVSKSIAQNIDVSDPTKREVIKTLYDYNQNPTDISKLKHDLNHYIDNVDSFMDTTINVNPNNRITIKPNFDKNIELFVDPIFRAGGVRLPIEKPEKNRRSGI